MSISERLQKLRGAKTLIEFAREHKTSPQNIHNYEKGRKPSAEFLTSLASKGININWVLTGEGPIYSKKNVKGTMPLTSELEKLPEEFREALRIAVRQTGNPPLANRKFRLAVWYQKLLRKIHDEIDRLHDI